MNASAIQHQIDPKIGTLTITLPGDLKSTNAQDIQTTLYGLMDDKKIWAAEWNKIDLDLSQAKILDSLGLNVVFYLIKRVQDRPATIHIRTGNHTVYDLLMKTCMNRVAEVEFTQQAEPIAQLFRSR